MRHCARAAGGSHRRLRYRGSGGLELSPEVGSAEGAKQRSDPRLAGVAACHSVQIALGDIGYASRAGAQNGRGRESTCRGQDGGQHLFTGADFGMIARRVGHERRPRIRAAVALS